MTMQSKLFEHKPHPHKTQNVNTIHDERLTFGDRVADRVAASMGSWRFVIIQSAILATWIVVNTIQLVFRPFDPYPYILLNLALSFQSAFAAPFIMISQNRQAAKDRLAAEHDYLINERNEQETREIMQHLIEQDNELIHQTKLLLEQQMELLKQTSMLIKLAGGQGQ